MISSLRTAILAGAWVLLLASTATGQPEEVPPENAPERAPQTVIDSDRVEMVTADGETRFLFTDNVVVTGNNLTVQCDRLEVFSARNEGEREGGRDSVTEIGSIQLILATGNVRIEQEGREATAGRAELFPVEGKIVLTENPVIRNEQGTVSGERITLNQGEGRALVERGEDQPARIVLPSLPDLGAEGERRPRGNDRPSN